MSIPVRILVLDKNRFLRGEIGAPTRVTVIPRHNLPSDCEFTVPLAHPRAGDLLAPGALVIVNYEAITGRPLMSGMVVRVAGSLADLSLTVTVRGAMTLLQGVLGWPLPTQPLTGQSVEFDVRAGVAETVVKTLISVNALGRLALPVTIAPDLGRGAQITAQVRFVPLLDAVTPLLAAGGIGLSVELAAPTGQPMRSSGLVVDVYAPRTYPRTLTDRSGVVTDWTLTRNAPTGTRTILGGPGDKAARQFFSDVDTAAETLVGPLGTVEVFVDANIGSDLAGLAKTLADAQATQAATPSPANAAAVTAAQNALNAGQAAFVTAQAFEFSKARTAGAARDGLAVTLAETATFRVGDNLRPGDRVTVEVGGLTVTDVMTECTVTWDEKGLNVTPMVGLVPGSERRLARVLSVLARAIRAKGVR